MTKKKCLRHRWESISCATNDGPLICLNCGAPKDLPDREAYGEWGGWLAGLNAMAVAVAEISDPVEPCEICSMRHVIPPPRCAEEIARREANEDVCVRYGRKPGGSFTLDKESGKGINSVMTAKKELKVKALPEEASLIAPVGMSVRDVYLEAKQLWIEETSLLAIQFPFENERVEGDYRETDSETFVACEVDFTVRIKLNGAWKIRRYVDKT
jgi:hypothetical protein